MTASSASRTHPVVNAITMEYSQVHVDNPVAEIKDDPTTAEDTMPAASIVADENSKKRASPESKDEPEAKKLDVQYETSSNGDKDDDQVAIAADAKEVVVATCDDESRANIEISSNDKDILPATEIETESNLYESDCLEESNEIPEEEINASAVDGVVVSIATEDEVECCA